MYYFKLHFEFNYTFSLTYRALPLPYPNPSLTKYNFSNEMSWLKFQNCHLPFKKTHARLLKYTCTGRGLKTSNFYLQLQT